MRLSAAWPLLAGGMAIAGVAAVVPTLLHRTPIVDGGAIAVKPGEFVVAVHAQGELVSQSQHNFLAPFQGKIEKLSEEGKDVKKNDFIAQIDTHDLEDRLREAQLDLGSANADLAQQDQDHHADWIKSEAAVRAAAKELDLKRLELAIVARGADPRRLRDLQLTYLVAAKAYEASKAALSRKENLVARGILRASDLSEARLDLLVKQKDMLVAQAKYALDKAGALPETKAIKRLQVKQAEAALTVAHNKLATFERTRSLDRRKIQLQIDRRKAQVAQLQSDIKDARILSPMDGTVVYPKFWRNGTLAKVSEGDAVWRSQAFLRVADFKRVSVAAEIEEGDIGRIRVGLPVRLELSTAKGRSFHGHVRELSSLAADSKQQSQREGAPKVFQAMVQVDEAADVFRPGLTVDLDFLTARFDRALAVPSAAVGKDGAATYVVMADGARRMVVLGDRNEDRVMVLLGLKAGERIRRDAPVKRN